MNGWPIVGESLVERIPEKGYQPEELHVLDGTKYDGLAKFADWVWSDTGSVFLDCNDEMDNPTSWHPDEVRDLTDAWAVAEVYNKGMCDITTWLEEKPSTHMRELLDFIEGKPSIPREQLRFPGKDFNEPED